MVSQQGVELRTSVLLACSMLRLTLLEPDIIQAILADKQPRCMSLPGFQRNPLPTE
jgi:hypothetical protein